MKTTFLSALIACILSTSPVWATTLTVNFDQPGTPFVSGTSTQATYTLAPDLQLFATGYMGSPGTTSGTLTPLYAKMGGGDESGLGLSDDSSGQHEITLDNFIQLNLSQLVLDHATSFSLSVESSTSPEAYAIYLSATPGKAGALYESGTTETSYMFTASQLAADPYVSLTATDGNVLLGQGSVVVPASGTPEPSSVLLLGSGFVFLGLLRLRRKQLSEIHL